MSKNKQPTRKQIQKEIDDLRIKEQEAQAELERADAALREAKRPQIEAQAEVYSRPGVIQSTPVYFIEETAEINSSKHERKSAAAQLSNIRRNIGSLRKALGMMGE